MKKMGVVIVTGAGGGLGSAMARTAYKSGYPVALIGRTKSKLEAVKKTLENKGSDGPKVSIHAVDLTDEKATHREFSNLGKAHGQIRALVNNAATWMGIGNASSVSTDEIRKSFDLNFFSAVHATAATLKFTGTKPKSDLSIVNVGATASLDSWPEVLPFSLARGALRGYSRALGRELGPKGIHVAHLVIDGMLDNARTRKLNRSLRANRFIRQDSVAKSILNVIEQDSSCWTMEWDVRPYNENW